MSKPTKSAKATSIQNSARKTGKGFPKPDTTPSNSKRTRVRQFLARFDVAGHLAERLAPHFKIWWVPVSLLAFPVLLLVLAFLIKALQAG